MACAQTFQIAHLPPNVQVHVALFKDVTNAAHLRAQLLAGNQDYEYAFIDASTLVSTTHLLAAIFRACSALASDRLRTRNVHAETVFALSPTNNIADSFKKFGVADSTKDLVAVKVSQPSSETSLQQVQKHLEQAVEGVNVAFDAHNLQAMTDLVTVKKSYKLVSSTKTPNGTDSAGITDAERQTVETSVLGMMAIKGS